MTNIEDNPRWAAGVTAAIAVLVGGAANIFWAGELGKTKVAVWLITMAMVVVLCGCIGKAITERWDGVLIDRRNRIALSRLQMLAWTVLILSGLMTAAASNLAIAGNTAALNIIIQDELLAAMGIAVTSLAAAPALLSLKDPASTGAVATRAKGEEPSWLDIFRGDEVGDEDRPDVSKIQQFLITLILIGVYSVALGNQFRGLAEGNAFKMFPPLDPKFIWLLGISHAGYLTYKAAPKPPPAPASGGRTPTDAEKAALVEKNVTVQTDRIVQAVPLEMKTGTEGPDGADARQEG